MESLIQVVKDEDWPTRMHVAEAFGKIGDPRAVDPLIRGLKDKDKTVREAARRL